MTLSRHDLEFYARHIMLPQIGGRGQEKIGRAKVLVVGAGGIGAPLIIYLTAAGVGTIGIADDDTIEISNLQRQILYRESHIGSPKTTTAVGEARAINSAVTLIPHRQRMDDDTLASILPAYDIIADGSDNSKTAHCLNRAAVRHGKILIKASVSGWSGQITTIMGGDKNAPCYACLFPPSDNDAAPSCNEPSCSEQGVLNMAVCVMAGWLGAEVIKCIIGTGQSLKGRLLLYDALQASMHTIQYDKNPTCPVCANMSH